LRKLLVPLALTVVVVLAGACGSFEDTGSSEKPAAKQAPKEPTAVEALQVAYKETAAERTARTLFESTTSDAQAGPDKGEGARPMALTMTGHGVVDFTGAASSATMEMFGMGSFEMRQIEDTVYMTMPEEFVAQMPDAEPWIKADLQEMYGQQPGAAPNRTQMGEAGDPTRQLEDLRGVSDSVEKVGEEVRGVRTTRYEAVVDLKKEAAGQSARVRDAQEQMVEQTGTSKLPVEVWIDEENRVRRYELEMNVPVPESSASPNASGEDATVRTRMVAEYYGFGTPVEVQAPPPGQTMDGSRLLSGRQAAAQ